MVKLLALLHHPVVSANGGFIQTPEKARAEALKTLKRGRQELSGIPIILKRHVPADGASPDQDVTYVGMAAALAMLA